MNLLLSAGEASGDLHGALLLKALRDQSPGLTAFGMGGPRLVAEGLDRIVAGEDLSVVGISEVIEKLPAVFRARAKLEEAARSRGPDAAVLIDFPDFHDLLARRLARAGIPLVYYISPQVWAWRTGRARTIARRARRILTLFPFEVDIYRRAGGDAVWVGHPLVDVVREGLRQPSPLPAPARGRIVLLPGSRRSELRRHWPPMREAAAALSRRFGSEAVAVRAPGLPEALFPGADERGIRVVSRGLHTLLASADLALVASGTATLESALCGTPMVVVYRTSAASFAIARALVRLPYVSLVNILAQERLVPELIQGDLTAARLESEAARLLESASERERTRAGLARVAASLGPPGASARAAAALLESVAPAETSARRSAS